MNVMDLIRGRRRDQSAAAHIDYFKKLYELAVSTRGERLDERAAAALDAVLTANGKTLDDVEIDLALLHRLGDLGDIAKREADAKRQAAEQRAKAAESTTKGAGLRARADALELEAVSLRAQADAAENSISTMHGERAQVMAELARRGFPPARAEIERNGRASELRQVRHQLAEAERFLADVEAHAREKPTGEAGRLHLTRARRERDELAARARELAASLPADAAAD